MKKLNEGFGQRKVNFADCWDAGRKGVARKRGPANSGLNDVWQARKIDW